MGRACTPVRPAHPVYPRGYPFTDHWGGLTMSLAFLCEHKAPRPRHAPAHVLGPGRAVYGRRRAVRPTALITVAERPRHADVWRPFGHRSQGISDRRLRAVKRHERTGPRRAQSGRRAATSLCRIDTNGPLSLSPLPCPARRWLDFPTDRGPWTVYTARPSCARSAGACVACRAGNGFGTRDGVSS